MSNEWKMETKALLSSLEKALAPIEKMRNEGGDTHKIDPDHPHRKKEKLPSEEARLAVDLLVALLQYVHARTSRTD